MTNATTKLLRTFCASLAFTLGCVAEFLKWVAVVGVLLTCSGLMSYTFMHFGYNLKQAASHYSRAKRTEALQALYGSVDWAAVVEGKNKKLKAACNKLSKKQRKGICPQES